MNSATNTVNSVNKETASQHYVYQNDPLQLKSRINETVVIVTTENMKHVGTVYTIDPVTGSYVLIRSSENGTVTVEVVPGHAIKSTSVISTSDEVAIDKFQSILRNGKEKDVEKMTDEMKTARKKSVVSWFRRHFVPVTESLDDGNSLTIMNALTIVSPFRSEDCYSENEIILGKIQGLLASMPKEWNENE